MIFVLCDRKCHIEDMKTCLAEIIKARENKPNKKTPFTVWPLKNMIMQGCLRKIYIAQWGIVRLIYLTSKNGHVISETYCLCVIPAVPLHLLRKWAIEVEIGI